MFPIKKPISNGRLTSKITRLTFEHQALLYTAFYFKVLSSYLFDEGPDQKNKISSPLKHGFHLLGSVLNIN